MNMNIARLFALLPLLVSASVLRGSQPAGHSNSFFTRFLTTMNSATNGNETMGGSAGLSKYDDDNSSNSTIDDAINRNDDQMITIGIVPVNSLLSAKPTTIPTLRPTIQPTTFTSTSLNVCPTPESSAFQSESNAAACVTNSDCKGKYAFGVPTCCIYPLCICGLADSDPSGNVVCVDDDSLADDNVNRLDDDLAPTTPITLGSPSPKVPTPLPAPTLSPTIRPFPDIACVSTPSSAFYQTMPQNRPCQTNAHCTDFHGEDGCCLSPNCICGIRGKGSSGQWQCFEAPQ